MLDLLGGAPGDVNDASSRKSSIPVQYYMPKLHEEVSDKSWTLAGLHLPARSWTCRQRNEHERKSGWAQIRLSELDGVRDDRAGESLKSKLKDGKRRLRTSRCV